MTATDIRITLAEFIKNTGITMSASRIPFNPGMVALDSKDQHWQAQASHWRCLLRYQGRRMTVPFSQGSAHTQPPMLADVLDCLASDASLWENTRGFADWAEELGFDADSRKAEHMYRIVEREAKRLKQFLGADQYETLLYQTERV